MVYLLHMNLNLKTVVGSILLMLAVSGCLESDSSTSGTGVAGVWLSSGGADGLDISQNGSTVSGLFLWNEMLRAELKLSCFAALPL